MFLLFYLCLILANGIIFNNNKLIISLSTNHENIQNTFKIINSIIQQNVDKKLYEILLIVSIYEYKNIFDLPDYFQIFEKEKIIKILFIKEYINNQSKLLYAIKEFKDNAIL